MSARKFAALLSLPLLALSAATTGHAQLPAQLQPAATAPQFMLGSAQPVTGQPFTVAVLTEAPADALPAPKGTVTLNWGDATTPTVATIVNSEVSAQHSYSTPGAYNISAQYSGDGTYAPATASQQVIALALPPSPVTLYAFGDSITNGVGTSGPAYAFPAVIAADQGWALQNKGVSSYNALDTCVAINNAEPLPATAYNTLLVGQNDISNVFSSEAGQLEYISAVTSCSVWLATAQGAGRTPASSPSNLLTGSWLPSNDYKHTGLVSTTSGSSLSGTFTGNILYAQLTSVIGYSPYRVTISIDGAPASTFTPPEPAYLGDTAVYFAPYSVRLPLAGLKTSQHSIKFTCTVPGSNGCYIDWFAGNGNLPPANPPYLWLATPFLNTQNVLPNSDYTQMAQFVRNVQSQLFADGFNVYLADVANWFSAPSQHSCMADQIHPNNCGSAIIAATFLGAMDTLLSDIPQIKLSTAGKHNYGYVATGLEEQYGVKVSNATPTAQPINVTLSGAAQFTQTNNCRTSLPPGAACEIIFTYAPSSQEPGHQSATWQLSGTTAAVTPQNGGSLLAVQEPTSALTLNAVKHNFGATTRSSSSTAFGLNIANPGSVPFNGSLNFSGATNQFSVQNGCTLPLPAFANCAVVVTFDPAVDGTQTMLLSITPTAGELITPGSTVTFIGVGVH